MIWESRYWKEDLERKVESLTKRKTQKRWLESSFAKVEQDIMISFYSIRKLMEARKITDELANSSLPVKIHDSKNDFITTLNWHKIDKHYDLENPTYSNRDIRHISNQIIHSFVFAFEFSEEGTLTGFFFNSDKTKFSRLYYISLDDVLGLFTDVANDFPNVIHHYFDPDTGKEKMHVANHENPPFQL